MNLLFQGEEKECSVSVIKVQSTAKKKWINLVLVYGLGETPMMLASNISIKSKEDVIKIARCYLDRWRIEEYYYNDMILAKNDKELLYTLSKPKDIPLDELSEENLKADLYQIVQQDIILKSGSSRQDVYEIFKEIENLLKTKFNIDKIVFPTNELQKKYQKKRYPASIEKEIN